MPAGWWSAGAATRLFKTTTLLQKVVEGDDKRLIWFFLAGWVSGAVFMILYARWWVMKHTRVVEIQHTEEEKKNERTS